MSRLESIADTIVTGMFTATIQLVAGAACLFICGGPLVIAGMAIYSRFS